MVTAKFRCDSKTLYKDSVEVRLQATNKSDGDNKDWSKWTPSGDIRIQITNMSAADYFSPGKYYTLTFNEDE